MSVPADSPVSDRTGFVVTEWLTVEWLQPTSCRFCRASLGGQRWFHVWRIGVGIGRVSA